MLAPGRKHCAPTEYSVPHTHENRYICREASSNILLNFSNFSDRIKTEEFSGFKSKANGYESSNNGFSF